MARVISPPWLTCGCVRHTIRPQIPGDVSCHLELIVVTEDPQCWIPRRWGSIPVEHKRPASVWRSICNATSLPQGFLRSSSQLRIREVCRKLEKFHPFHCLISRSTQRETHHKWSHPTHRQLARGAKGWISGYSSRIPRVDDVNLLKAEGYCEGEREHKKTIKAWDISL